MDFSEMLIFSHIDLIASFMEITNGFSLETENVFVRAYRVLVYSLDLCFSLSKL
jgi:hypothetical protein